MLIADSYGDTILTALFGGGTWAVTPIDRDADLYDGNPFDSGAGLSGSAYAPFEYDTNDLLWTAATAINGGVAMVNSADFDYPTATANWATARYLAITAGGAGTPDLALKLPEDRAVLLGETLTFPAGSLRLELSGGGLVDGTYAAGILARILNGDTLSIPASWYLSLWLDNPFNGGSEVSTSGTGYSRISVANDGSHWESATVPGKRARRNVSALRWPASGGAAGAYGRVKYVGLSSTSNGSPKFARPLPGNGRVVGAGSFFQIEAGGLVMSLGTQEI